MSKYLEAFKRVYGQKGAGKSGASSWDRFLNEEGGLDTLEKIEGVIAECDNVTPEPENVLRFMDMNPQDVRVVVLGQDPYPTECVATGRAFEVNGLSGDFKAQINGLSKLSNRAGITLLNILYLIAENKLDPSGKREKQQTDRGKIWVIETAYASPSESFSEGINSFFDHTTGNNVLWLNAALTCVAGESNIHAGLWSDFTSLVLRHVETWTPTYFLWGSHALEAWWKCVRKKGGESRSPSKNAFISALAATNPREDLLDVNGLCDQLKKKEPSVPEKLLSAIYEYKGRVFHTSHPSNQGWTKNIKTGVPFVHTGCFRRIATNPLIGVSDMWGCQMQ